MFDIYKNVSSALLDLLKDTDRHTKESQQKIIHMQNIYLSNFSILYNESQKSKCQLSLSNSLTKFYFSTLCLEQMWSISHSHQDINISTILQFQENMDLSNEEISLIRWSLENFLFQSRSFLELYILYLCYYLKVGKRKLNFMSLSKFYEQLDYIQNNNPEMRLKANFVKNYFIKNIFGDLKAKPPTLWGNILSAYRNKVVHREPINLEFQQGSPGLPTLEGMSCDRFCQEIHNEMFFLLNDLSSHLYELEWKTGPYKPDLWD